MVLTRSAHGPCTAYSLLDSLLAGHSSRASLLLEQDPQERAQVVGPSNFGALHAAALSDCHRFVAPLVAAGLDINQQIDTMDGQAAFALRQFLREHCKLPSSKLCAVFRGVTPLHIASWLGHHNTVQALLQAGADTEAVCLEGRTALAIACYFVDCRPKKAMAVIQALLDAGANPLCADFHGIGSLVLSPHCPERIATMLLDRLLLLYGGPSAVAHPQESSGETAGSSGGDAGQPGGAAAEGQEQPLAQGQEADAEVEAQPGGGEEVESAEALAAVPTPLLLPMPPEKLVDVVQASLAAKHWHALEFFLSAADPQAAYPQAGVDRLLSLAIMGGDERLVLRLLRSGLRPDAGGANSQGHPHVALAAIHGHVRVLDLLCAHGGTVTLRALHHAADARSLHGLRLLLARGRPPVLAPGADPPHIGGSHSRAGELCVVLRLLRDTAFRLRYCYRADLPRHAADSLAMVEALAAAGYRPTVYPRAIVHDGWVDMYGKLRLNYDPTLDKPAAFDLQGVNRYTWLAAQRLPWSPARHHAWPLSFRAAVRELLLCYHKGSTARSDAASGSAAAAQGPLTRAKRARLAAPAAPERPRQRAVHAAAAGTPAPFTAPRLLEVWIMPGVGPVGDNLPPAAAAGAAEAPKQRQPVFLKKKRGLAGVAGDGERRPAAAADPARRPLLAMLPEELLMRIIPMAAYPVSAWV